MKLKKIAALFGLVVVVLACVLVINTLRIKSLQVEAEPAPDVPMNEIAAAERLAGALRIQTISPEDPADFDSVPFLQFHTYLEETFPNVHSTLTWETVNEYSLLYRWDGSDPNLEPIALLAHIDVVPVEPGTDDTWTYGAYDGRIEDGFVWGRGALDMKNILIATLEAAEMLIAEGIQPRRTIYFAFGHDEERGGQNGAVAIAALLESRGIRLDHVLDEGGAIVDGMVPGIEGAVAVVGVAEKGYASVELLVEMTGGHSSMPPAQSAIGILSAGIQRLEENQMPLTITGATEAAFDYLGPEMSFGPRLFVSNQWLFGGLLKRIFGASAERSAMLRTTTAPTIFQAGIKENVLPSTSRAVVNHRILSGDNSAEVLERRSKLPDFESYNP
jgi:carboxypeptidase PM20D1